MHSTEICSACLSIKGKLIYSLNAFKTFVWGSDYTIKSCKVLSPSTFPWYPSVQLKQQVLISRKNCIVFSSNFNKWNLCGEKRIKFLTFFICSVWLLPELFLVPHFFKNAYCICLSLEFPFFFNYREERNELPSFRIHPDTADTQWDHTLVCNINSHNHFPPAWASSLFHCSGLWR